MGSGGGGPVSEEQPIFALEGPASMHHEAAVTHDGKLGQDAAVGGNFDAGTKR